MSGTQSAAQTAPVMSPVNGEPAQSASEFGDDLDSVMVQMQKIGISVEHY